MKKYVKARRWAKISAFALSFLFVVTSITTTYAASYGVAGVHDELYQETEGTQGELSETPELKEVFVPASENNDYSRIKYARPDLSPVAPLLNANETVSFNWTVEPGTRYCSGKFKVSSGQKIVLSAAISPSTQTCWIGIMDPPITCVMWREKADYHILFLFLKQESIVYSCRIVERKMYQQVAATILSRQLIDSIKRKR